MVGEVGERGHQAGPLLGSERGGELLEALEAGLEDPARDVAAGLGDADALHAAVLVVLAALEVAAAQERVDRSAAAGEREAELLGDLLDRQLAAAVGQDAERLDVRHREVELVEEGEHRPALALHEVHPEGVELGGELLGRRLRLRISCLHERKYYTRAPISQEESFRARTRPPVCGAARSGRGLVRLSAGGRGGACARSRRTP